jgi:hypothetical protein
LIHNIIIIVIFFDLFDVFGMAARAAGDFFSC